VSPCKAAVSVSDTRWHCWKGVSGLVYGSRALTSPPAIVRAEDPRDLLDQIQGWEGRNC
jgi:hypothetical protein